jgi:hypothetical protein
VSSRRGWRGPSGTFATRGFDSRKGSRRFVAKTFGAKAWPTIAAAIVTRWFSTDDADEHKLDEECVNALVGAEGAAQALGLVPPPPNVGPIESAAFEREVSFFLFSYGQLD